MKNRFDFVSEEEKAKYLKAIIAYFQDERGEEIGIIAAQNFLEFFLATFGEQLYAKAVKDCQKLISERFEDIKVELDTIIPDKD